MSNMSSNQLVLKLGDNIARDDVELAILSIGYRLSNIVPQTLAHPAQSIFVSKDKQTLLHLLFEVPKERAVIARGVSAEQAISMLRETLTGGAPKQKSLAENS